MEERKETIDKIVEDIRSILESACEADDNYRKVIWDRKLLFEEYIKLEKAYFELKGDYQKSIKEQSELTNEKNLLKDHISDLDYERNSLRNTITELRRERDILRTMLLRWGAEIT